MYGFDGVQNQSACAEEPRGDPLLPLFLFGYEEGLSEAAGNRLLRLVSAVQERASEVPLSWKRMRERYEKEAGDRPTRESVVTFAGHSPLLEGVVDPVRIL